MLTGYKHAQRKQTYFYVLPSRRNGPGSSVGVATDYGLDGPGSNPGGD